MSQDTQRDNLSIPITQLPTQLSYDEAVEAAYREDLDWVEGKLRARLSVLIECDKQLSNYIYKALRKRFRSSNGPSLRLLSGHPRAQNPETANPTQANMTLTQRLLEELKEAIYGARTDGVFAITHLDILTTTTRSSLGAEAREAAAIMYENPDLVFLGFTDPNFEIPEVIEKVFTVKYEIMGIGRDKLSQLILQREARKFGVDRFNPFTLYKYLSGLNAVRARQVLGQLESRVDFDPNLPKSVELIYQDIRKLTLVGDLEVPRVDLEADIGGYKKVKKRIKKEILDLLLIKESMTSAEDVRAIEEIVPKGMIFHGPPGTGKTFFAKAIATSLNATVSIVSGPELKSKWVGESEENLRKVFAQARKSAPALIIFDELDSFASARGTYTGSGVEHSMVNQLLTEMDGFRKEELVFVVGTTNFEESLDPALMRPGRFEFAIEIPYPNKRDRRTIFEIYARKFNLEFGDGVLEHLVKRTQGFVDAARGIRYSGDHLYAIMRGLKREQLRRGAKQMTITEKDVDRVMGARAKKRVFLEESERRTVAIHEAGHAVLAYALPHCPTVERVTIASEEEAYLGYVMHAAARNQNVRTRAELLDSICVALGGREAEQLILGDVSSGCWNDLQQATQIATMMVEQFGMSPQMGLRAYRVEQAQRQQLIAPPRDIADITAARLDEEINRLIVGEQQRCARTLAEHREQFDALVELLLEKRTIGLEEMKELFGGVSYKVHPEGNTLRPRPEDHADEEE